MLLIATAIMALALVFQSSGMQHIGPYTFQACRCLLGAICMLPIVAVADRNRNDNKNFLMRWADPTLWKAGLLCGVPLGLGCMLQQVGLQYTEVGKSAFLTTMYIMIVPVIGLFVGKKPSITVILSMLLALCGLYFLTCVDILKIKLGDYITLAGSLMFAAQILFVDRYAGRTDALRLSAIQALVCSIVAAIPMILTEFPSWNAISACAVPLLYTGCVSMGIGYSLQIVGQKDLEPTTAALIISMESVFAVIFGALFLKEILTKWELLGCGLMFIAVILSQIPVKKKTTA